MDINSAFDRTVEADRTMRSDPADPHARAAFWACLHELCAIARLSGDVKLAQAAWRAQSKPEATVTVYSILGAQLGRAD
ncbi:MAG: hypothetical protein AAGJ74_09550, partial [Pseudomonadota bacterium]